MFSILTVPFIFSLGRGSRSLGRERCADEGLGLIRFRPLVGSLNSFGEESWAPIVP